ncbi:hypothetical protein KC644_00465 [Candidatus Berkelbacteria bacterium]|nr:hypothetical protein [Candidatus Berkelbacteria bacterium]
MLKVLYVFFTGLLLAVFVGVGVAAFYPALDFPEYPTSLEIRDPSVAETYPTSLEIRDPSVAETSEERQMRLDYEQQIKQYETDFNLYARNASLAVLGGALIFMAIDLILAEKYRVIGDGFLLGGLFTLLYSVILGFQTEDNRYQFILVSVGLVVAIILGYLKFVKAEKK